MEGLAAAARRSRRVHRARRRPRESYLRDDLVVHAALGTGCDAIHPGYGFLRRTPRWRRRAGAGRHLRRPADRGDGAGRATSSRRAPRPRRRARRCSRAGRSPPPEARALAGEIGYPLLVKAAGGGGGPGHQARADEEELDGLISLARSEAARRLRRRARVPGEAHRVRAPRRGADRRRRARHRAPSRRARLLRAAPLPEGGGGGARALPARPARARAARSRRCAFAERIGYRNLGTVEFIIDAQTERVVLPGGQLSHPGRAPGDRGDHVPGPSGDAAADRRGRADGDRTSRT